MMRKLLRAATLALLFTSVASAQTTGSITGVVTDGSSGQPVVGAMVVATSPASPGEKTAVTDAKGAFTIGNLPAGKYKVQATLDGYKPETRADLALGENVTLRANLAIVPEAVQMEEVVVTGSRIKRKDLTAAAPVTVVSKEQIQASGKISLGEFLQSIPEQGNTVNAQVNNGNDGSVRVSLRSLGSNRTLVLVNGRRFVAGGTGADASVDLGSIPAAAVERIEVLKDGASAVYGSDAVAGVVNVITKKRYNGTEVSAYAGQTSRGDGTTYDLSATTGVGNEKGNLLFSLGYQKQEPIYAGDRDWSKQTTYYDFSTGQPGELTGNSGTTPDGRFTLPANACAGTITDPAKQAACASVIAAGTVGVSNSLIPNGDGTYRRGTELYNTYPTNYLYTPSQRIQLYSTGDANLGSAARAFYEASYVNRHSAQNLAPMPVVMNSGTGNPISKDSMYNPFGVDIISWRKRTLEFGNRSWTQDLDTFRVVLGFDGALGDWAGPLRGWNWEASYNYGKTAGTEENDGLLWANRIGTAVGPSGLDAGGNPTCYSDAAKTIPIPGCIPMNVLGGQGTLTPDMKTYVGFRGVLKGYNRMEVWSANIGGELFKLMSDRAAGLSVGVDYRKEKGLYLPDPVSAAGISTGNNASPTEGGFNVKEAYGELLLPIINNAPGIYDLELSLAARAFKYSTFGSDSTYKAGLRYAPVRDLVLRGTYSTAFRAPNINELYASGTSDSYDFTPNGDPCFASSTGNCAPGTPYGVAAGTTGSADPATQFLTKQGANSQLKPETAKILTFGAVIEPRWVPNLSFTVDFYTIDLQKTITFQGASVILEGCYTQGIQADCNLIHRDADGVILTIDDKRANAGATKTAGLDVSARYALPTSGAGRFNFLVDGTFIQVYDETQADLSVIKHKGNYDSGLLMPTFKGFGAVSWSMDGFGAGLSGRYFNSLKECESTVCSFDSTAARQVSSYFTADLYLSYMLKSVAGTTSMQVGVQNIADTQPPPIYTAANYSADPDYQYAGRFFYGRITQSF
jgi:iron complex outermembrane receptor protein